MLQQFTTTEIEISLSTCPLARGYGSARLQNETPLSGGTDAPSLDVSKEFIARAPLCHFAPTQLLTPFTGNQEQPGPGALRRNRQRGRREDTPLPCQPPYHSPTTPPVTLTPHNHPTFLLRWKRKVPGLRPLRRNGRKGREVDTPPPCPPPLSTGLQ